MSTRPTTLDIIARMAGIHLHIMTDNQMLDLIGSSDEVREQVRQKHKDVKRRVREGEDPSKVCLEVWPPVEHDEDEDYCPHCGRSAWD